MNILVIGANGTAGQHIVNKSLAAGHTVTGLVRNTSVNPNIKTIVKDALELTKEELLQFDVVINATSAFTPDTFELHTTLTTLLATSLAGSSTRLLVVGGAGSLFVNPERTVQLYDTPEFPADYLGLAKAQGKAIAILRNFSDVQWTFFSPAAEFDAKGPVSDDIIYGTEQFILNAHNESYISYETYADILVKEIEEARFIRQRFTAVQN